MGTPLPYQLPPPSLTPCSPSPSPPTVAYVPPPPPLLPALSTVPIQTQTYGDELCMSRTMGKRAESQNYSTVNTITLLDIAEEVEPLGENEWATVGDCFQLWARETGRQNREKSY